MPFCMLSSGQCSKKHAIWGGIAFVALAGVATAAWAYFRSRSAKAAVVSESTADTPAAPSAASPASSPVADIPSSPSATPAPSESPVTSVAPSGPVRAVLFDMDGTLLESSEIWYELLRACCLDLGFPELQFDDWKKTYGQSMHKNVELFMPGTDPAIVDKYCFSRYADFIHKMYVYDGAVEALEHATRATGGRTYLVTNCPEPITRQILAAPACAALVAALTNPDGSLRVLQADDPIPHDTPSSLADHPSAPLAPVPEDAQLRPCLPKPSPEMLFHAARVLGVHPTECALVGDSIYDMAAIANAGGVGVGVGDMARGASISIGKIAELPSSGLVFSSE